MPYRLATLGEVVATKAAPVTAGAATVWGWGAEAMPEGVLPAHILGAALGSLASVLLLQPEAGTSGAAPVTFWQVARRLVLGFLIGAAGTGLIEWVGGLRGWSPPPPIYLALVCGLLGVPVATLMQRRGRGLGDAVVDAAQDGLRARVRHWLAGPGGRGGPRA